MACATDRPRELVFRARGVRKVHHTGTVEIEALRGIDLDVHPPDALHEGSRVRVR